MIFAGLVLTLSADAAQAARATARLRGRRGLTLGERQGRWLAAALEAGDDAECRAFHAWACEQPGIEYVDVVFINFEETTRGGTLPCHKSPVENSSNSRR